jgi:hypothetical protein
VLPFSSWNQEQRSQFALKMLQNAAPMQGGQRTPLHMRNKPLVSLHLGGALSHMCEHGYKHKLKQQQLMDTFSE